MGLCCCINNVVFYLKRRIKLACASLAIQNGPGRFYLDCVKVQAGPEVIKLFVMLNSTEHEISLGHKNKNTNN